MPRVTTILIADDHALVRTGLRLLLETQADMRVVGECGTHQEVLASLASRTEGVDIVTLDLSMPGGTPAALIEDIVRQSPRTRVVVLTMHNDPAYARLAIAAGASAFIVKSAADTELISAIRTVTSGGMHSSVSLGHTSPPRAAGVGRPAGDSLSEREREVLLWLARGLTNKQIADKLFLSVKTVESYRARLMTKLGLHDRADLTRYALDTGLLEQGPAAP